MKKLLIIVLAALLFTGCTGMQVAPETITFTPKEIDEPLKNPGMGWATYDFFPFKGRSSQYPDAGAGDTVHKYYLSSFAYSNYYTWRDLEPEEGVYRFDLIDQFVDEYKKQGIKVHIGFHLTDPTSIEGTYHIPDYVVKLLEDTTTQTEEQSVAVGDEIVSMPPVDGKYYNAAGSWPGTPEGLKFEPFYWNSAFLEKLNAFIEALAKHYEQNPVWQEQIIAMDISTFGFWGEWHTTLSFPGDTVAEKRALREKTLKTMIDQYFNAFKNQSVRLYMNVVGSSVKQTLDTQGVNYAVDKGAAMVRRCVGEPSFSSFDEVQLIGNSWKENPVHGEWGISGNGIERFTYSGMNTEQAIEMALSLKMSTLGWYIGKDGHFPLQKKHSVTGETLEDYYQKRCGYRLVLREAAVTGAFKSGGSITLEQQWEQIGNTTMYDKYSLAAYLVGDEGEVCLGIDEDWDARGWVAEDNIHNFSSVFTIPALAKGTYDFRIAVVDRLGRESVNLAIAGKDTDPLTYGRYTLGQINIR